LVLGGGVAAMNAAQSIRGADPDGRVVMVTNESFLPYYRPMLTKQLAKGAEPAKFLVHDESWYADKKIEVVLGSEAVSLDTSAKSVTLSDKSQWSYSKCVLAVGAECFLPPLPGISKPGVYALRKIDDFQRLRAVMEGAKTAIVVGGGALGLEAADALCAAGISVTVFENGGRLMPRQLDGDASELLSQKLESSGIHVRYEAASEEVVGDPKAEGIKLKSGETLLADLILFSTGAAANVNLAKSAGLAVERGIVVNEYLETDAADVYACGDCAQYHGVSYKLMSEAAAMGKLAGSNAAGGKGVYEFPAPPLYFSGAGTSLFAVGANGTAQGKTYEVDKTGAADGSYRALYYEDGALAGAILLGDTKASGKLEKAVQGHWSRAEVEAALR
jgi:NAD(P)H-nitrite reductase large subunit